MATALTPSSNTKHWWPRISASRENSFLPESSHLFSDIPATIGGRPHTSSGATRPSWMTSVTNSSSTPSNAFTATSKSSRFNLAAVIGFGSKSKRQQPVDIQDPPLQIRSLPTQNPDTHIDFGVASHPTSSSSRRLSRALVYTESGTSAVSTDVPLTPADDPSSFGAHTYQHSTRAVTDLSDPFTANPPLSERRSSTHSDKSLSKRLMQKIDGKTTKTTMRLPLGDGPKKESRDRSSTLPSRARTSKDASDAYQALRAVEPPWAESAPLDPPSMTSASPSTTIRQSKASKPGLPWSHTQARGGHKLQTHQRTHSSSISNENLTESSPRTHTARPSTSSSTTTSPSSSTFTSQFSSNSYSSGHAAGHLVDILPLAMPLPSTAPTPPPGFSTPLTPSSRTKPRPPPTSGLPPTPTPPQSSSSSLPPHVRSPTPPSAEQHPLRSRSGTVASTSAVSFASSLSSLSFNSRPSPQEPPSVGAYDYPSLLNETLPVSGSEDPIPRRNSNSGSSSHSYNEGKDLSGPTSNPVQTDHRPQPSKSALLASRPLPSSPASSVSQVPSSKRERVASAASLTSEAGKTVRRQRSFHNTSLHALTPMQPTLRHYNSFDPPAPPGSGAQTRSPPLPPFRSPPLAPTQDLPPLPPSALNLSKRGSTGKDSITSPRRRLFGANRHDRDRDRERKQELDSVDTSVAPSFSNAGQASASSSAQIQSSSSSSWFDDRSAGSEPASASSTSTSTAQDVAQHIVPPAELLRLGAQWERENESRGGLRRAKSSWSGSRDLDGGRALLASSSKIPSSRSSGNGSSTNAIPAPSTGSRLPRSTSLLSKASSAPSFNRSHGTHAITSPGASSSAVPLDLYTSLSPPPPRRQQRSIVRGLPTQGSTALPPPPPRRTSSTTTTASSGSTPPKGALIERKPSFLDMTSTRQSVTLDVPQLAGRDELERDSFLELSREMGSIDTIRESISSVDSFME